MLQSWLKKQESSPDSCTLDQLNAQSIAFFDTSKNLQTQIDTAGRSVDELRARVTSDLARLKKGGGATAVTSLYRKALLGLQSRLDGLSPRVNRAGGVCLKLTQSASKLKSQAEAVSKLPSTLKDIVEGPFDRARLALCEVLSQITEALNPTAAVDSPIPLANSPHGPQPDLTTTSSSATSPLATAALERTDFRQEAVSVAGQARKILDQFEGIMVEANQLQVSHFLQNNL